MADFGSVVGALFEQGRAPELILDLEAVPVPIGVLAVVEPGRYRCVAANDALAAAQRFGHHEHFVGVMFEDLVRHPVVLAEWLGTFAAALEVGGLSTHHVRAAGSSVHAAIQVHEPPGWPTLLVVATHDVTQARRRLEAAGAQLEAVIADSSVLVSMVDVVSQTRVLTNQALAELHGRSIDDLRGTSLHQPLSVGVFEAMQTLLRQLVGGAQEARSTVRLASSSGQERPLAVVATWVPSEGGELQALVQMVDPVHREPTLSGNLPMVEAVLEVIGRLAVASGPALDDAITAALSRLGDLTGARVVELLDEVPPPGWGGGADGSSGLHLRWERPARSTSRPLATPVAGVDVLAPTAGPDHSAQPMPVPAEVADRLGVPWATLAPVVVPDRPSEVGAVLLGADEPLHPDLVVVGRWIGSVVVAAVHRRRHELAAGA